MKKWKKALIALIISVFAIGAASCNGGDTPPSDPPGEEQAGLEYTVTFSRDSWATLKDKATGDNLKGEKVYVEGTEITVKTTAVTGRVFVGWEIDGTLIATEIMEHTFTVTKDMTVRPIFAEEKYTVTFVSEGQTISTQEVKKNEKAAVPQNPTRTGYTFDGWTSSVSGVNKDSKITADVTFTAKWKVKNFTVTFDADGGDAVAAQTIQEGKTATKPTDPTKTDYNFLGWFVDGQSEAYDFSAPIMGNVTLKAKWVEKYCTVSFDADNGSEIDTERVEYGTAVEKPTDPVNEGYTFLGWYDGEAAYDFSAPVVKALALKAKWQLNKYTLNVTAGEGGTVTAENGEYDHGTQVEIAATADEGYKFVKWSDGDQNATRTVTMTKDFDLSAEFVADTKKIVNLSVEGVDASSVTLSGANVYEAGEQASVFVSGCEGYTFIGWFGANGKASDLSTYTFTVEEDVTLTAKFELNSYTVTATATAGGSATGSNKYSHGATVTLTAIPDENYFFVGWYQNGVSDPVSTEEVYEFTASEDVTLTAKFERVPTTHVIDASSENPAYGSVSGAGQYAYGTEVTLVATPEYGYKFAGWYQNDVQVLGAQEVYTFNVEGNLSLTAKFEVATYSISAKPERSSQGAVSTSKTIYTHGEQVVLVAEPKTGYVFAGWYENGRKIPSALATYTFTANENRTLVAKFTKQTFIITVVAGNGGTAVVWLDTESAATDSVSGVEANVPVNIKAVPNEGYVFVGWYENDSQFSANAVESFGAEKSVTLTAKFKLNAYTVTLQSEDETKGTVSGGGSYNHGMEATVTAMTSEGCSFDGWYDGNGMVSSEKTYSFIVLKDTILTAKFTQLTYTISVMSEDETKGTVKGGGTCVYNNTLTIIALPADGFFFDGWYVDGVLKAATATHEITVTESATWTAHFANETYEVTIRSAADAQGTVTGGGAFSIGTQLTATATRKTGYVFDGWYDGDEKVSSSEEYTFEVKGPITLVAKWNVLTYSVTFDSDGGEAVAAQTIQEGASVNVPIEPTKVGHKFRYWSLTKGGATAYDFTTPVTEATTLYAVWKANVYQVAVKAVADDGVGGTVSGGGNIAHGQTATLKAKTNAGYTFLGWFKDSDETAIAKTTTYEATITADVKYTAKWEIKKFTVTVDGSTDDGVGGTATGGGTFKYGTTTLLTATIETGYTFLGWFKNDATTATSTALTYELTVKATAQYTAKWAINQYKITTAASADSGTGGTVTGAGTYKHGATVTLTAKTSTGYTFEGWYKDGATTLLSSSLTYTTTATSDAQYTAKWKINSYMVSVYRETDDGDGGTASADGIMFNYGTKATLTATTNTGYSFLGWFKNDATTAISKALSYEVTVKADVKYTAKWKKKEYTITTATENEDYGTVTGGGTFKHGESVTVTATEKTGYTFKGWYNGTTKLSGNAIYTFDAAKTLTLTAKWKAQTFVIKATPNFTAGGTVTGADSYDYNTKATLVATPNENYEFIGWYSGSTLVKVSATYQFTVTKAVTLKARFSAKVVTDSEHWALSNSATTTMTSSKVSFKNTADGDTIFTKAQYTNFTLQYDVTGLRNNTNYAWLGFIYGAKTANPFYSDTSNNFVYLTKEGWNSVTWYKAGTDKTPVAENLKAESLSDKLLTENTVNVLWKVNNGKLSVTLTFADGTTASKTGIPSYTGSTKGYVAIPASVGTKYSITNLTLIDLNGSDFNATPTTVTTDIQDLVTAKQVRLNGRTHFDSSKSNALVLRNTASGFEVYTTSANVKASIAVSSMNEVEKIRMKVWVDGGTPKVINLTSTTATSVTLASGLSTDTLHHIKVAKMTEPFAVGAASADSGNIYVYSLSYKSSGAPAQVRENDGRLKLEVYGDSITCGYGALGNTSHGANESMTEYEDGTVTYAYKTAEELDAHINVVAHQGWAIGQSRWGTAEKPLTLPAIYDKVTDAHDIAWDFTSYTPDIVIVSLGTNDQVNSGVAAIGDSDYNLFCWQYLNFLQSLVAKYPNAKFVLCHGMMNAIGGPMEHAIATWLIEASKTAPAAGYVTFPAIAVDLTGIEGTYMTGGGTHPSEAEHEKAAAHLVASLRGVGWVA